MGFYILAIAYIFTFVASLYGLFVTEVNIGFSQWPNFHFTLSGWKKNVLCVLGLIIVALIPSYPIVTAVYRALKNGHQ